MPITLQQLADACNARLQGGNSDTLVYAAADIVSAGAGEVTQLTSSRYQRFITETQASACFVAESFAANHLPAGLALLYCQDPEMSFIKAVNLLHPERPYGTGVALQAIVAESALLAKAVYIAPYAVIGEDTVIGQGSQVLSGAYVGRNVKIGKQCRIYPYAVIYDGVEIGDDVIIHSGAIIGADGFGYKYRNNRHVKVPQVGNVVLEDRVEIGANACIDRGALGSTRIGAGTKIDNLVQVGHNNKVGKNVIMCGLTGVSGSCTIEDGVILAGSTGVADHVTIGRGAVIMARSGIASDVAPGAHMFGSPAKDKREAYKEHIALSKLPDLIKAVKVLEEKIRALERKAGVDE
jgi:UDP-3-O-[3-hydroxymyristoyl] glucosamine N-acyltransferase